jgi:hypothetical protein
VNAILHLGYIPESATIVLVGLNQKYLTKMQYLNLAVNIIATNEYEKKLLEPYLNCKRLLAMEYPFFIKIVSSLHI